MRLWESVIRRVADSHDLLFPKASVKIFGITVARKLIRIRPEHFDLIFVLVLAVVDHSFILDLHVLEYGN